MSKTFSLALNEMKQQMLFFAGNLGRISLPKECRWLSACEYLLVFPLRLSIFGLFYYFCVKLSPVFLQSAFSLDILCPDNPADLIFYISF